MSLPASELRLLGVAAALGGLLIMMFAAQPSVASVSSGLVGLVLFGASRLVPHRKPEPVVASGEVKGNPSESMDTMREDEAEAPIAVMPGDLHAVLQRKVRVNRPPNQTIASSVLPRSRAVRSPSAT